MKHILLALVCFFSFQFVLKALGMSLDTYNQQVKNALTSFEDIKKKANRYGSCWVNALGLLNKECTDLDEIHKSQLAKKFTHCVLADSGLPVCPCGPGDLIAVCLNNCFDK